MWLVVPQVAQSLRFHSEDSSSPEEIHFLGVVDKIPPIPDSGAEYEGGEVEEETVPVPDEVEGVEDVVEDGHGDEGFV